MATPEDMLLKGPMPPIKKQSKVELKTECEMWRRIWQWVPDEVKYYVARTGTIMGLVMRNYTRHLGTLLETHWTLEEIELGIEDKVYDTITGEYYFEKKRIRTKLGGVIETQFMIERKTEAEVLAELAPPKDEQIDRIDLTKEKLQRQESMKRIGKPTE